MLLLLLFLLLWLLLSLLLLLLLFLLLSLLLLLLLLFLIGCESKPRCCQLNFRYGTCFKQRVSWNSVKLCRFTLKLARDVVITDIQMHRTDKFAQHSSIIWPIWLNGWVFVYELSRCGLESRCYQCHLSWLLFCFCRNQFFWLLCRWELFSFHSFLYLVKKNVRFLFIIIWVSKEWSPRV